MLVERWLPEFARLLVGYSVDARSGDEAIITFGVEALPLAREVAGELFSRGAYARLQLRDEVVDELFYRRAPKELLERVSPIDEYIMEKVDVLISIVSPMHTKPLAGVDPGRLAMRSRAMARLTETFMRRDADGSLRWVVTAYPTSSMAQEAGMSLLELEELVVSALKLRDPDPVASWRRQAEWQERVVRLLSRGSEIKVEGPGVDLLLRVDGRKWINDDGKKNMPGGEVFTGPHEDATEGYIEFDFPAVSRGVELEGVRLVFRRGEVVEARAARGEEHLKRLLEVDDGARRLGEAAFGLNYEITRGTKIVLFDEKIGGTMHLALGASYPATGGRNVSAIHLDLVKDLRRGAIVKLDGDVIYRDGRFIEDYL